MTDRRLLICAAVLLGALLPTDVNAQQVRPKESELRRFERVLDSLRQRVAIPGLSAAIVFDDSVIWSRGYGFADRDSQIVATPHTPYEVASLSKPFGAVLLLRLVHEGKVRLDDPMSKYSSDYKTDSVLVRHVLTHTSEGVPGTRYDYNGDLFANLFDVIVKGSGRRYRELLSNEILVPLGMNETAPGNDLQPGQAAMEALLGKDIANRYGAVVNRLAKPYRVDSTGAVVPSHETNFGLSPANGVVSTVLDLAKFDAAIDRDVLLPPATKAAMWTPAQAPDGRSFPYALGWFVQRYGSERLVWHNGNLPDRYSALNLKRPDSRLTLLLLANSDALSMPFKLAAGDVTRSAFACAFLTIVAPIPADGCAERSGAMIEAWRAGHRMK
jgi:CubicO group peptidase (beta-lactamase class C family)